MLRRLWQWLKRLFRRLFSNQQASPPGKQTQVKPLQPLTDAEYEALFFQLLAGVGEGWTRGRVKAFLDTQYINQADLVVLKFAGFQQLTVDLAVQSGQMVQALELAEQGKNACLSWLLTGWSDTSPSWEEIQQLLNPTTAMVYWHLSPYALHTFILTPNAEPIVKPGDNRLDDFAAWVKTWNNQYNQGKKEDQQPTSWRVDLLHRLQELAQILDISTFPKLTYYFASFVN